jgi:RNA polymerase sigma-70 factor, ECF subfamily
MALPAQWMLSEGLAIAHEAEDELEVLVREHARLLYRIGFSVLRNADDAEDVVQEVFLRVLRSRNKLAGVLDPKAYLARIGWNVAIDFRRRRRDVSIDATEEPVIASMAARLQTRDADIEDAAGDRQIMRLVEQAILSLPQDLRDALTLSAIEELTAPEAAQVLGVAEATVRTRVFRARQMLREKLSSVMASRRG